MVVRSHTGTTHEPDEQISPLTQLRPHTPQLLTSESRSTHDWAQQLPTPASRAHNLVSVAAVQTVAVHRPAMQVRSLPHEMPQPPQFEESVSRLAQPPPLQHAKWVPASRLQKRPIWPDPLQGAWAFEHRPATQVPPRHEVPQLPQLRGSVCRFEHCVEKMEQHTPIPASPLRQKPELAGLQAAC